MPSNLYNFISQNENMTTLNKIKIKYLDVKKMILEFLQYDQGNLKVLSDYLEKNGILYQFLYGNLFPKCFSRINDYCVRAKTLFNTYYQNFIIQKNVINWQNNNNNNNLTIKEEVEEEKQTEIYDNASPINMTTLDKEETIKKETKNVKLIIMKQNIKKEN